MQLLTSSLAAFYVWTVLRVVVPFVLPERLAILLLGAVAFGVLRVPLFPREILAVAGAMTLLVVLFSSAGGELPTPWNWRNWRGHIPGRSSRGTMTGVRHVPGD